MAGTNAQQRGLRLLSLDGGGMRGVSELVILNQLMLDIQANQKMTTTPKPCEVFDLICGTSTGGLIAILLGRLNLTVDQALQEYAKLGKDVFSKPQWKGHDGTFSATTLENSIKDVVKRFGTIADGGSDEDMKLVDETSGGGDCRVFVCTRSAKAMNSPRLFKSYAPFGAADYPNLKIWEAARATSAAPLFFRRVFIGPEGMQEEFIDGGMGTNNPAKVMLKEATRIFQNERPVACIISIGCGEASIIDLEKPGLIQNLLPTDLANTLGRMVIDCRTTALELEERFHDLPDIYFRLNVDQGLQNVGLEEWNRIGQIKSVTLEYLQSKDEILTKVVKALTSSGDPSRCTIASLRTSGQVTSAISNSEGGRAEKLQDLLWSLSYQQMHNREEQIDHRAERVCKDTFNWALDEHIQASDKATVEMQGRFRRWIVGKDPIFWVCGKAASGKSTFMRKVSRDVRLFQYLRTWAEGANITQANVFFTSEGTALQQSREGLLRSLLFQILHGFRGNSVMAKVLSPFLHKLPQRPGTDIEPKQISWSWPELSTALDLLLQQTSDDQRLVFFIDGLDEFSVLASTQAHSPDYDIELDNDRGRKIRSGFRELAHMLQNLPNLKFVKICVSSRPFNEFHNAFSTFPNFKLELLTRDDIVTYVQNEFEKYVEQRLIGKYRGCICKIVDKASGVFLWVNITTDKLIDGIENGQSTSQLWDEIEKLPDELGGSNGLYMHILTSLGPDQLQQTRRILDVLLHARHYLTALVLSFALDISPEVAVVREIIKMSPSQINDASNQMEKRLKSSGGLFESQTNQRSIKINTKASEDRPLEGHINRMSVIAFMHLTVKQFLLRPDAQAKLRPKQHDQVFDPYVALLSACVLRLKTIGVTEDPEDIWGAVKDSLWYAEKAEISSRLPQSDLLKEVDKTMEHLLSKSQADADSRNKTESWRVPRGEFARKQHWAAFEPKGHYHTHDEWEDDFVSLAVQSNLTLYLAEQLDRGLQLDSKSGRPLLLYAIAPSDLRTRIRCSYTQDDWLGWKFSSPDMVRLLLKNDADPNRLYCGQHIWQWPFSIAMEFLIEGSSPSKNRYWRWSDWQTVLGILLDYGARPDRPVLFEAPRQGIYDTEISPMYICLTVSWEHLERDSLLPRRLMSLGYDLQPGELGGSESELDFDSTNIKQWYLEIKDQTSNPQ